MADIVFNIAKGKVAYYAGLPAASDAIIVVPIETSGIVSDATMIDYDDLGTLLAGASNEQSTMGRKTLTDADLAAFPAPDDSNDRMDVSLPTVTWTAASGNAISKLLVCYDSDTTGGTDSNIIPLTMFDFSQTPSGADIQMTTGVFYRAS